MNLKIANRLLALRKAHGYSQEALAEKLGISRQSISKWERAEASPDTDNLIALARLYDISLDELLDYGEPAAKKDSAAAPGETDIPPEWGWFWDKNQGCGHCKQEDDDASCRQCHWYSLCKRNDDGDKVHIGMDGIFVKTNQEKVRVDRHGVHVEENGKESVHVGMDGIRVDGERVRKDQMFSHGKKHAEKNPWQNFAYPVLAVIAFFLWGWLGDAWNVSWIVFLTIPIYYTLVDAIIQRNPSHFAYPVLVVIAFLLLGMCCDAWHPGWLVFLTIPLYYSITSSFGKKRS